MVRIDHLEARYRLPVSAAGERDRLDAVLAKMAGGELDEALDDVDRLRSSGDEEVCIREVVAPVRLRLSASDASLTSAWGLSLSEAIRRSIGKGGANVVRFRSRRHALAAMVARDGEVLHPAHLPPVPAQPSLYALDHVLYRVETVPILVNGEAIASLTAGNRFELQSLASGGDVALFHSGAVASTTLEPRLVPALEQQLRHSCQNHATDCEISLNGERWLVLPMHRSGLGADYGVLSLRSLDKAVSTFEAGFAPSL